jgi:hypothetical protein
MAEPVSILICRDAAMAGRTLLARRDLRVRWALTVPEAESVIRWTKCAVCVAREPLAKPVLQASAQADRKVATIVLLEPDQWSSWREYFEAGATSVLQVSATDQLLDAMSDATGLTFRTAPRIAFKNEVRFALGEEGGAWKALNLSATGISIVEFPPYALGSEVDLAIELGGKRYEFNAIVSQILRVGSRRVVGLAFRELSPELLTNIEEVIRAELKRSRLGSEPVEEFDSLDESTMLALRSSTVGGDSLALMRALTSNGKVQGADAAASWLIAACNALSPNEVAAVRNPQTAPQWAQDALLARLRVYEIRARAGSGAVKDADMREIFGLCQRLAESADGADEHSLVQVANIRAEILRALYDTELLDDLRGL